VQEHLLAGIQVQEVQEVTLGELQEDTQELQEVIQEPVPLQELQEVIQELVPLQEVQVVIQEPVPLQEVQVDTLLAPEDIPEHSLL